MDKTAPKTSANTLRKQLAALNRSLEANNLALEEAQSLTHLGSWQWSITTNTISWSDELYRIYGLQPQERPIDFESFIGLIHPEDRERVQAIIGEAYQTGKPFDFEHRIILPSGSVRTLSGKGKSVSNDKGQLLRMLGTSQDITEQKASDTALHLSDERFRAVTAATSDIVYDLDLLTGTMWYNETLYRQYGYPRLKTAKTQKWWLNHIHPDDAQYVRQAIKTFLNSTASTHEIEYRFRTYRKKYIEIRDRASVIRNNDGTPQRMIGSLLDITQQKNLERAKDEFITLASHQLRTPATAVKQYLGMLDSGYAGEIPVAMQPFVSTAYNANERQLHILNDLLRTAQLESGQYELVKLRQDIAPLIQDVIDSYHPVLTMRSQSLNFIASKLQPTGVDAAEFKVAISNFLENASKYSPDGAAITITARSVNGATHIAIADQGVGIDPDDIDKIFAKFTRIDNALSDTVDGSGLGLYFVRKIIDLHGGVVNVDSTIGRGSTFTVVLPL